ncbi:hypothetical protein DPEC_G00083290 [Dallia pectoralis]|uniref:Uncharacterized protein n=1 Tax=Dallia pectoralis TaxID=75939 RepID=A0ACC2GYZ5_DALPE|nr:hypothetical protein DPEC_G00083290 [Dallia pectoralis]
MDHKMERSKDMADWGVKKAKLAVAVAVIKSKPPGTSGRQHAEYLARMLRSQDEAWKTKYQQLQEEVLRLRQELHLSRMLAKPKNNGDDVCDLLSQDPTGPGSSRDLLNSDMDSGCGTDLTETPRPTPDPASPHVTGAPDLQTSGPCEAEPQGGDAALPHMQFLQSLLGLSGADGVAAGVEVGELGPGGDGSVVSDSVCRLLTCLVAACGDHTPQPLLGHASRVAARAVDSWLGHRQPPALFAAHVEGVLEELVGALLRNDQINRFGVQERLAECLVLLGGSCFLRSLIIRHVLSEINQMAEHLWITCQGESSEEPSRFDVSQYENSFYLFRLLERLLQAGQGSPGVRGGTSQPWIPELGALQDSMEQSLIRLSDDFPLFVLYMWRVWPLLTPPSDTNTANT